MFLLVLYVLIPGYNDIEFLKEYRPIPLEDIV